MGSDKHTCDVGGKAMGVLEGPGYALPGDPVRLPGAGVFGRVRLIWRCCGAFLVECLADPDSDECADTYTLRVRAGELAPIPWRQPYSVPCIGAAWSLTLPCGDLAGEGCDHDTIAAQDDGPDRTRLGATQWELDATALPG